MAEATQKAANYTAEMVDSMIEMYNELGNDGLDEIAEGFGQRTCTFRSVRSKLVHANVYMWHHLKRLPAKQDGPSKRRNLAVTSKDRRL